MSQEDSTRFRKGLEDNLALYLKDTKTKPGKKEAQSLQHFIQVGVNGMQNSLNILNNDSLPLLLYLPPCLQYPYKDSLILSSY